MESILPPLLVNEHYEVLVEPGRRIVRVIRSSVPFQSAAAVEASCGPLQRALDDLGRSSRCVLIDSRNAPARNDPEYEGWFQPHRTRMVVGFRRSAIVMRSVIGKLQAERLMRDTDKTEQAVRVFTDEALALAYLRGV